MEVRYKLNELRHWLFAGPGERGGEGSLYAAGQDHSGGVQHPQRRSQRESPDG